MEVTERDIERIPPWNLNVPRAVFAAVWAEAARRDVGDWYMAGVVETCKWLAGQTRRRPATGKTGEAYEELIDEECSTVWSLERWWPTYLVMRPGFCDGIRDTLLWAWRREGFPRVPLPDGVGHPPQRGDGPAA
jgi:hypothetical protein